MHAKSKTQFHVWSQNVKFHILSLFICEFLTVEKHKDVKHSLFSIFHNFLVYYASEIEVLISEKYLKYWVKNIIL